MSAKDIALVYGVPSQLIGIPDAQTYSNFATTRLVFFQDFATLWPQDGHLA